LQSSIATQNHLLSSRLYGRSQNLTASCLVSKLADFYRRSGISPCPEDATEYEAIHGSIQGKFLISGVVTTKRFTYTTHKQIKTNLWRLFWLHSNNFKNTTYPDHATPPTRPPPTLHNPQPYKQLPPERFRSTSTSPFAHTNASTAAVQT